MKNTTQINNEKAHWKEVIHNLLEKLTEVAPKTPPSLRTELGSLANRGQSLTREIQTHETMLNLISPVSNLSLIDNFIQDHERQHMEVTVLQRRVDNFNYLLNHSAHTIGGDHLPPL